MAARVNASQTEGGSLFSWVTLYVSAIAVRIASYVAPRWGLFVTDLSLWGARLWERHRLWVHSEATTQEITRLQQELEEETRLCVVLEGEIARLEQEVQASSVRIEQEKQRRERFSKACQKVVSSYQKPSFRGALKELIAMYHAHCQVALKTHALSSCWVFIEWEQQVQRCVRDLNFYACTI